MNAENNFQQLEHDKSNAVISFDNGATFKINKFMEQLNVFFKCSVLSNLTKSFSEIGLGSPPNRRDSWSRSVEAEILEPKSGEWKKGKVRMRVILEFCSDEPEVEDNNSTQNNNSLDDIRQTIT